MQHNLLDLIKTYGEPDVLIDHWSNNNGYAIWGFRDTLKWDISGIIKSGEKYNPSLSYVQTVFDEWKKTASDIAAVGFINYNFKDILYKHISFKNSNSNIPYLFFGFPDLIKQYKIEPIDHIISNISLEKDLEQYQLYKAKIDKIKLELKKGNVYQINYTNDKSYSLNHSPFELFLHLRNKSQPKYGYYMKYKNHHILSFSPELFFKKEKNIIQSTPMKGTRKRSRILNTIKN